MNVLILGYGEMGHAMEFLLEQNHQLFIWDKYPAEGFQPIDLDRALPESNIILFCLPVNPHREILKLIQHKLKSDSLCLSIAKGLDETGSTAAQIFQETLKPESYALLYGPMISEEIQSGRPAFAQLGCNNEAAFSTISELFKDSQLYLEPSSDISGISWSVILKNVYAIVFGVADELKLGDNMRGYLAVAALHELNQIVIFMGGKASSPFHLAGLGDLITTATSEDSHHHELGRRLAKGETENINGEGIHTLKMVNKFKLFTITSYPLFSLIDNIVKNPGNSGSQIELYLKRVFDK